LVGTKTFQLTTLPHCESGAPANGWQVPEGNGSCASIVVDIENMMPMTTTTSVAVLDNELGCFMVDLVGWLRYYYD